MTDTNQPAALDNDADVPEHDKPDRAHDGHSVGRNEHRSFRAIRELLQGANLDGEVRARVVDIFTQLAEAEGRVHRIARRWRVPVPLATERATG